MQPPVWFRFTRLTHAYAVTVHKAQGAEFPALVLPLLTSHAALLGRAVLYTAVTRARELVVIVGQRRALAMAVKDWRRTERTTALAGLISGTLKFSWLRQGSIYAPDVADDAVWEGLIGDETVA